MKHRCLQIEVKNWRDVFVLANILKKNYLFRGQSDKDWAISSSLERLIDRIHPHNIDYGTLIAQERQMIEEFQWKYPLFSNRHIEKENYVEWLSVMQHYGAATRLVDFSNSFFVAVHMAIFESSSDAAVWAINEVVLNRRANDVYFNKYDKYPQSLKDINLFSIQLANEKIGNALHEDDKGLIVIKPQHSSERIYRQQGLFIMPTTLQAPFYDSLESLIKEEGVLINFDDKYPSYFDIGELESKYSRYKQSQLLLLKIYIKKEIHRDILDNLREMNINSEMLFPGIEGLAKSLNYSKIDLG